jgi:nucleoside-diphosphate-sugar epimerase
MGSEIFDITRQYDQLALNYLKYHSKCRYIFISSGAIYGNSFDSPVHEDSVSQININKIQSQDWYALAKLQTEFLHRSLIDLPIVDVRIFNYFSSSQDINSRSFIADILRSIHHKAVLETSDEYMARDYIGPNDFFDLINAIVNSTATNDVVDCYSKEPIDKPTLLSFMEAEFGLHYKNTKREVYLNATGKKPYYYSLNKHAKIFGYAPQFSSLENIAIEARKFFK